MSSRSEFRRTLRETMAEFRAKILKQRHVRRDRLAGQKGQCQADARAAVAKISLLYKDKERALHEERKAEIEAARKICTLESAAILAEEKAREEALQHEAELYRKAWARHFAETFPQRVLTEKQLAARRRAAERRSERDQEVERDIEATAPELLPLWQSWGRKARRVPGMSRYEAFLHAVHDLGETELVAQLARAAHISDEKFARDQAAHYEEWAKANEGRKIAHKTRLSKTTIVPF